MKLDTWITLDVATFERLNGRVAVFLKLNTV